MPEAALLDVGHAVILALAEPMRRGDDRTDPTQAWYDSGRSGRQACSEPSPRARSPRPTQVRSIARATFRDPPGTPPYPSRSTTVWHPRMSGVTLSYPAPCCPGGAQRRGARQSWGAARAGRQLNAQANSSDGSWCVGEPVDRWYGARVRVHRTPARAIRLPVLRSSSGRQATSYGSATGCFMASSAAWSIQTPARASTARSPSTWTATG